MPSNVCAVSGTDFLIRFCSHGSVPSAISFLAASRFSLASDTPAVVCAEAVHPGEDKRFQGYPLRYVAKMLRPEADALLVLYLQHRRG